MRTMTQRVKSTADISRIRRTRIPQWRCVRNDVRKKISPSRDDAINVNAIFMTARVLLVWLRAVLLTPRSHIGASFIHECVTHFVRTRAWYYYGQTANNTANLLGVPQNVETKALNKTWLKRQLFGHARETARRDLQVLKLRLRASHCERFLPREATMLARFWGS